MDSIIEDQARLRAGVIRGEGLSDVRVERIYPELARRVLGETDMPWRWEYGWYQP